MDEFLEKRKVISVWEHFFEYDGLPCWSILVSYDSEKGGKPEWNESQRKLWKKLQEWRLAKAKEDGHPAFYVLHDQQLIEIVNRIPESISALDKIRGIGESKCEKYGPGILKVIAEWKQQNNKTETTPPANQ